MLSNIFVKTNAKKYYSNNLDNSFQKQSHYSQENIDLEKYMQYLLNVEHMELRPTYVNENTGHALEKLKFNSKIDFIAFEPIYGDPFDAKEFTKFCDAIRSEDICMDMVFYDDFDEDFVESFKEIMRNYQNNINNGSFNISRVSDDDVSDDV